MKIVVLTDQTVEAHMKWDLSLDALCFTFALTNAKLLEFVLTDFGSLH